MKKFPSKRFWVCGSVLLAIPLLAAVIIPMRGKVSCPAPRTRDAAYLRQIGQASLVYASGHNEKLPEATDVWDYARLLAESDLLDDANSWLSRIDPATHTWRTPGISVLDAPNPGKPRAINPAFLKTKPSVAVVLGKLSSSMPDTTPIAWTRGLQPDGTWAKHSPYGGEGGFIVFMSSHVVFYRSLATAEGGELVRFEGKSRTANILEALPPECRIGEYVPTSAEQSEWAKH